MIFIDYYIIVQLINIQKMFIINRFIFFKFLKRILLKLYEKNIQQLVDKTYQKKISNEYLEKKLILFDVGAHKGESIKRFSKLFKDYQIEFHCFEPIRELVEILKNKKLKNVKINNFLLLDKIKNENKFYKMNKSGASSIHKPQQYWLNFKKEKKKFEHLYSDLLINSDTIDNYCQINNINKINLLKIDTQGSEDMVLIGAKEMIKTQKIDFIEVEIILGQYYEKKNDFKLIENNLNENYNLVLVDRMINLFKEPTSYINCLYMKKDFFEKFKKNS